jgi:hypothetical protein
MAYKLLYIEDLDPSSIIADLKGCGFEMVHFSPTTFEKVISEISSENFSALLLDYRLTQGGNAVFDAPTIAQTQRTKSSGNNNHFPIFLISTESNISSYYEDFTSNDLFDLSISKEQLQKNLPKYTVRLKDFIDSYQSIQTSQFNLPKILGIEEAEINILDTRLTEKLSDTHFKANTYKIARLIYHTLIRSIGALIGEDVLSARLGIDKGSDGWSNLRDAFGDAKYTGIYSKSYQRWWSSKIETISRDKFKIPSLRRLKAKERTRHFEQCGFANLKPPNKLQFSESTNFWTICKDLKLPIDPIDGLELIPKENVPWQDKEYISLLAAMKTSDFLSSVKPTEMDRFREFAKSVTS